MTIELYFSNQIDPLARRFSRVLADEIRTKANLFEAPVVIVPNANLAKWLQLFLAKRQGIFINVDFQYLEAGLWAMLAALDSKKNKTDMLDVDRLKILLLSVLQDLKGDDPDFLPVTRYLMGEQGRNNPDAAARLWQLSDKLAQLFKEYEFHRVDMIRKWTDGSAVTEGMERCQQRLYAELVSKRKHMADRTGRRLLSMMEYADQVLSGDRRATGPGHRKPVHFFGLSQISAFHLSLIGRLRNDYAIDIYALNPSREYWEDIRTPGEKRWIRRKNVHGLAIQAEEQAEGALLHETDNALLAAWGKPGRESVRLLCELADYDFNACFSAEKSATGVLQRIQRGILTLAPPTRNNFGCSQDRTLQIVACPGVYREVETVYNNILYNLACDDALLLTDIAILVPDISAYKPVFDAVFNRRPKRLSYNLVDSRADIESVYGKAVLAILSLAAGRFSRTEVFDLMFNPCFMSRWRIDPEEIHVWASWADALNIFHTFDRKTKIAKGYPASGAYTWKQGLQRLRLSRIMSASSRLDPDGADHFQECVPFSDVNTGDVHLVEKFCRVIEALHAAAARLNIGRATGGQWKRIFFDTCDQLIEIPEDFKGEAAVRKALIQAFDNLALHDQVQDEPGVSKLGVDLIKAFIRGNLGALSGGRGDYLTGGVTVSALQPMRPIPFKIVYIMGMEEGNFPGKADVSSLDLRLVKRRIGDISLPERNRYLFLEILLSVKDKLVISYVARDLQRDRLKQPCSVVNQLRRYVAQEILEDGVPFRVSEIPLAGSDDRYCDPGSVTDWSDVVVNDALSDRLAYYRIHRLWERFEQQAAPDDSHRVERFDPDLSFDRIQPDAHALKVEPMTSGQLKNFMVHPVRYKIQRHLGLFDEQETIQDIVSREDEPFFSEFPLDYQLKMGSVKQWVEARLSGSDADPDAYYLRAYEACRRRNQTPEGVFAKIDRDEIMGHVNRIAETLDPVLTQMLGAKNLLRAVFVGEPVEEPISSNSHLALKRFDPLTLKIQTVNAASGAVTREVALHGQLPWMWQDLNDDWHVLVLTGSGRSPREPDKYVLEPVLFYLLCMAGEVSGPWIESSGITLHVVYRELVKEWTYAIDGKTARACLIDLVSDAFNQSVLAWLPFETVTNLTIRPHTMADSDITDIQREQFALEVEEALDSEEDVLIQIVKPTVPPDAFDTVRRRFRLFYDYQTQVEK